MKKQFIIGGHCEHCWAEVDDDRKCPHCGVALHGHLGAGRDNKYIQARISLFDDPDVHKVRLKELGKVYCTARLVTRFRRKADVADNPYAGDAAAVRRCRAKYGPGAEHRYYTYHQEVKKILTFNSATGRLFLTTFIGGHKHVVDCTYGTDWMLPAMDGFTGKHLNTFVKACADQRKQVLPQQYIQIDTALAAWPKQDMSSEGLPMDEKRTAMTNLFMALRFPNLINTSLPLYTKFFDYNRKLYKVLAEESSGKKLTKTLFPGLNKPAINYLRETGNYPMYRYISRVFSSAGVNKMLVWPEAQFMIMEADNCNRRFADSVPHAPRIVKEIGEKRILNMIHKHLQIAVEAMEDSVEPDEYEEHSSRFSYIIPNSIAALNDTGRMVKLIRAVEGFEDYKIPRDSTLRKIHDKVNKDYNKLKHTNLTIPYTDEEMKLEMEINGYTFRNPRDTHKLLDIGITMNMCVGAYGREVAAKDINIVYVCNPDGELALCIEHKNKGLIQVKSYGNSKPGDEEREAVIAWAEKVGINWKCHDMNGDAYDDYILPPQAAAPPQLGPAPMIENDQVPF